MSLLYKTFSTPLQFYVFDCNTNTIINVYESQYRCLRKIEKGDGKKEDYEILTELQKVGYCKEIEIERIQHPEADLMPYYLERKVEKITLQVTQNCNLRCSYCPYTGGYSNRRHADRRMSFETAKRAIDFLALHSKDAEILNVGFYGGEPLLEIALIKQCVNYIQDCLKGKKVTYSITTNGTLLTRENAWFLAEHDFSTRISLDGPKEIHNVDRRFADGKGSFDHIMANLLMIKECFPDYYQKISINSVITPQHDLKCMEDFFDTDKTVEMLSVMATYISDTYIDEPIQYGEVLSMADSFECFKVLLYCLDKITESHIPKVYHDRKTTLRSKYKKLMKLSCLPKSIHPGGPCLAGIHRLFVDVNGNFMPCEKVSEKSIIMNIGSLDVGFDIEKIQRLINVGQITEQACKNCWAINHCTQCAAYADDLTPDLSSQARLSKCEGIRYGILEQLKDICFLRENGYDFIERSEV